MEFLAAALLQVKEHSCPGTELGGIPSWVSLEEEISVFIYRKPTLKILLETISNW